MKFRLRSYRFDPERDEKPGYDSWELDLPEGYTLLDVLNHVKWHLDGTLTYRRSCRSGICGSCAVNVGGKNILACETQAAELGSGATVNPLPGFRVLKDLTVDLDGFFSSLKRVKGWLIQSEDPPLPTDDRPQEYVQSQKEQSRIDLASQCILCASCTSGCPSFWGDKGYLGPAALYRAYRYIVDSRDGHTRERLAALDDESGAWRCHDIYNCTGTCPKNLEPATGVQYVKVMTALSKFRRTLGMG